jgi:hypothetical protein
MRSGRSPKRSAIADDTGRALGSLLLGGVGGRPDGGVAGLGQDHRHQWGDPLASSRPTAA